MANKEIEKSTQVLAENIAPMVLSVLDKYRKDRKLSQIAKDINVDVARLSEIVNGKIPLTMYYLLKLTEKGYVDVTEHITHGKDISEFSKEERRILWKLALNEELSDFMMEDPEVSGCLSQLYNEGKKVSDILKLICGSKK